MIININILRFQKRFRDKINVSILTKNQFYVRLSSIFNISLINYFTKNFNNLINLTNNSIDVILNNVNLINLIKNFVKTTSNYVDQINQNNINSKITREISIDKIIYNKFINSIINVINK